MSDETSRSAATWQNWLLGIGAMLIGAGIIGLNSTLSGLRSDIEVVKTDITYLKKQAESAESFRAEVDAKINDHEVRIKLIESDKTRTSR
jgi:hypothetical protein